MVLFPMLFSHGGVENTVIGGWSLGGSFAFCSVLELEAGLTGPRSIFELDTKLFPLDRALQIEMDNIQTDPGRDILDGDIGIKVCREFQSHAAGVERGTINALFIEMPR